MTPRTAGRVAWALWAATCAAAVVQVVLRVPRLDELARSADPFPVFPIITGATLAAATVGALIVSRHPRNAVGWLFCASNCLAQIGLAGSAYADAAALGARLPAAPYASWVAGLTGSGLALSGLVFLLLLFPTGHLPSRRWRPVAWVAAANFVATEVVVARIVGPPADAAPRYELEVDGLLRLALLGTQLVLLGCLLAAVASVVVRWRRAQGEVRQQLRLFVAAAGVLAVSIVLVALVEVLRGAGVPPVVPETLFYLSYGALPVAAGLAILKYRLYEIDVVLNRAVVVACLAAASTTGYVAVVVAAGRLLGEQVSSGTLVSLLATALAALAVQPARRRVQRLADRVVYGRRAAPYDVLARFGDRIRGTLSVDEVLPQTAQAAAQGLAARAASVAVVLPDGSRHSGSWPAGATPVPDVRVPVLHLGQHVGDIAVQLVPGTRLGASSAQLLDDLAAQAGLALHNVRLTAELRARLDELRAGNEAVRASRARLVATQTAERQRLERQIAQQVQPHLSALSAGLHVAAAAAERPVDCSAELGRLFAEATAALEALREIARGVFPPVLAERGVCAALQSVARSLGVHLELDAPAPATRYSPRAETTAYFCCHEVLQAAAAAGVCARVVLRVTGGVLRTRVSGPPLRAEVARQLADRVAAAGGTLTVDGTTLDVELPVHAEPEVPAPVA